MGLKFSRAIHNELTGRDILDLNENDTHHCFTISSIEQPTSNGDDNDHSQCIVHVKSIQNNNDHWFIYLKENDTLIPFNVRAETIREEMPFFFEDDDDAKVIFHDCQSAIFFIGRPLQTLDTGKMSHLLMDYSLKMNIGMCPIGTRVTFLAKMNNALDNILARDEFVGNNVLLHTLLIGKISNEQKYEQTLSKAKSMPNWSETLRAHLSKKLPTYMVPSHFVTVSTFPLNPNGKIDRKSLPEISMSVLEQEDAYTAPSTELEKTITNIWKELIYTGRLTSQYHDSKSHQLSSTTDEPISLTYHPSGKFSHTDTQTLPRISTTTSFFNLGGDSLLLVQIYGHYRSLFNFETERLTMRSFFERNTIAEHAKLLETIIINDIQSNPWHTLHIIEGKTRLNHFFNKIRYFLTKC